MIKCCLVLFLGLMQLVWADCQGPVDLLVVGDSQTGSMSGRSYFGNFLQQCLTGNFMILGKGSSVPSTWIKGGLEQVSVIQRDPFNAHLDLGKDSSVPLCKKRIPQMLDAFTPKKVLFFFGDNMIAKTDIEVLQEAQDIMKIVEDKNIPAANCFFLTPTFEMEVTGQRKVPLKNLANIIRIRDGLIKGMTGRCQHIDGLELMKASPYFDGKDLLHRVPIAGRAGCDGPSVIDNVHVCGEAAKDMAQRICLLFNP